MADDTVATLAASELRRRLGRGELTPSALVEACLARIERLNGAVNAVVTRNERALDDARALERAVAAGAAPGPLYGLPVGVKDVTVTAGLRTTFGSTLYADHVPEEDAGTVARLRRAGAVILAKTNTPEFATGGNTFNEVFGRTVNPWHLEKSAGGSTGGGAAGLATGMFALAEGTDLGGSLRIPASFCGVVGLRPSVGLVPAYPSAFLWDSFQVNGPMARTAEDVAMMLQAIAGPSRATPLAQPIAGRDFVAAVRDADARGLRLAYCADVAGIGIDTEVERVCRRAALGLRQAGAGVEEIELDLSFAREPFLALRGLWMVTHHLHHLDRRDAFGNNLRGNIEAGLEVSAVELAAAERARSRLWQLFCDFFERYDLLLTPSMAVSPFPASDNYPATVGGRQMATYIDWVAPTFVLSLTGLPVASVPCGRDAHGLPAGLQALGPPQGEEAVLALARVIQEANPIGLPAVEPPS